jgi:inner membrane protein
MNSLKTFTKGYTFKIAVLALLVLLLLIPLSMMRGLVRERGSTAREAEAEIMSAWGRELAAAGPVIAINGIETTELRTKTEKEGEKVEIRETPFTLYVVPERLDVKADFQTEIRRRGIFSVPLFSGELRLSGGFDAALAVADLKPNQRLFFNQAEIIIALSSQKGIRKINSAVWNGGDLFFRPGTRSVGLLAASDDYTASAKYASDSYLFAKSGSGIHASLPAIDPARNYAFDISIAIQGGQSVKVLPVGQDTRVALSADWASPSFNGAFLPKTSAVTDKDFSAEWEISYLSRDIPLFWISGADDNSGGIGNYSDSLFGVSFFRTIDAYSLNTRAVKYAILFLIVPFFTIFLLEILTKQRVHPVQYVLSGIANIVFYLLLLSLSEQMPFHAAYIIAAVAVAAMMFLYSRTYLPSWAKSAYVGLVMAISYVLLYAVLNAESYALLIGSIGTFLVTGLVMFLTRKFNWYGEV